MLVVGLLLGCRGEDAGLPGSPVRPVSYLDPGVSRTEGMRAGETHPYLFEVRAGELVRADVEQVGIDVTLALFDEAGRELTRVDSPTGDRRLETAPLVAPEDGAFRLEVIAAAGQEPGRYRLSLSVPRPASETDRRQVAGEWAYAEARWLQKEQEAAASRRAWERFAQALEHFQASGDRRRQAASLRRLGEVRYGLGELAGAFASYREALDLYRELEDPAGQGIVLSSLGPIYRRRGELERAIECYEEAQELAEASGNDEIGRTARNNLAGVYLDLGELEQALEIYRELEEAWSQAGRREKQATAAVNVGTTYLRLGELEPAREAFEKVLRLARAEGWIRLQALALDQLGFLRWRQRRLDDARLHLQEALGLYQSLEASLEQARVLNSLGLVHLVEKEWQAAEKSFQESLEIFRRASAPRDEAAVLINLGWLRLESGDWRESLQLHEEALEIFQRLEDLSGQASAHYGAGRALAAGERLAEALDRVGLALELVEDLRSRIQAETHRTRFFASRQDYYELYVELLMRLHRRDETAGFDGRAFGAGERRRARGLLDLLAEAGGEVRHGVAPDLLAEERRLRDQILQTDRDRRALPGGAEPDPELAAQVETDMGQLLARYEALKAEIRRQSPHYAALTQPEPLSAGEVQEQLLDEETQLLAYSLGREKSYLWLVSRHGLVSRVLPGREPIEALAQKVHDRLSQGWEPDWGGSGEQAVAKLSEILLGPVAGELSARRLVVVPDGALHYLPFAALPLPAGAGGPAPALLIDRFEVVHLPSASALALLRREVEGRPLPPGSVAVLADPVFQPDDPRLATGPRAGATGGVEAGTSAGERRGTPGAAPPGAPALAGLERLEYSHQEAQAILSLAPPGTTFSALGFAASREVALSGELSGYRVVHFATHGLIDPEHPRLSGVVLSLLDEAGQTQDGVLRLLDLYNLELPVELVVVSACRSALGEEVRGEGMVGLTRGFMYAGAPRLVVSLWNVNDPATAELMARFYRGLFEEGLAPAAALRAAQRSLRRETRWKDPYFWAGFILQGEWR